MNLKKASWFPSLSIFWEIWPCFPLLFIKEVAFVGKKLVLVGGGHAHMITLANLKSFVEKGFEVSVVAPSPFHYYSGMGPGMLGKTYAPEQIRFATRRVVENAGGTFIPGKAERIDPGSKTLLLESGEAVSYDVISFNAGSTIPVDMVTRNDGDIFSVKPIEKLQEAQSRILALSDKHPVAIGVVGGGPASVEIAGNAWRLANRYAKHPAKVTIFSGRRLLPKFSDRVRNAALKSLERRHIRVLENTYAQTVETGKITTRTGMIHPVNLIFLAGGVKPSAIFSRSGLVTGPDGGLLVNSFLQSVEHSTIFGGGDCIHFKTHPLDKVGVYAVRQNPILFHNLLAALEEKPLMTFKPGGDYLLIFNLGDGTGILQKKKLVFSGRLAFFLKDTIDRKFMKRFQAIES
jgi:NADH dehydrogenase FAD-containing subunit